MSNRIELFGESELQSFLDMSRCIVIHMRSLIVLHSPTSPGRHYKFRRECCVPIRLADVGRLRGGMLCPCASDRIM